MNQTQYEKLKFHQGLILTIALDQEPEQYAYFHFVINNDISENESKLIIKMLRAINEKHNNKNLESYSGEVKKLLDENFSVSIDSFKKGLIKLGLNVNEIYLLKALRQQRIEKNICDHLLKNSDSNN